MLKVKQILATLFLFALLTPTAIQIHHAFEDHEHVACTSTTDKHLHKLENDCNELHLQLKVFNYDFNHIETFVSNTILTKNDNCNSQQLISNYSSKKSSRAPPFVV